IKDIPCYRLIPFSKNGLWGYLDSKDKSIVVKPVFQHVGFMTNMAYLQYKNETAIYISNDGKITVMQTSMMEDFEGEIEYAGEPKFELISSIDGFKGFKHQNGYIKAHSDIYSKMGRGTVKIKNKIYGIAYLDSFACIIDEDGNTLKGLNFNDSCTFIMKCYSTKDTLVWFWFTDNQDGTGFKNENGETYFYNVFNNYPGFGYKST